MYNDSSRDLNEIRGKSFFDVLKKDDEKLKSLWLNNTVRELINLNTDKILQMRRNLDLYMGYSRNQTLYKPGLNDSSRRLNTLQKLVIPHLHDLTETRVSQMTKIKPSVEVLPKNNEWEDRSSAKVVDFVLKHLWYVNNIDYLVQLQHRHARIFGESYIFVDWNPNKGDLHPLYVEAKNLKIKEVEVDGEKVSLKKPIKVGDIEYNLELPWRVFLQNKQKFEDVQYAFRVKIVPTSELQEKYKEKADKIKVTDDLNIFDINNFTEKLVEDHTVVYEFYHLRTEHLPDGRLVKFTNECILEDGEYPYQFEHFPFVRLTDLDIPGKLRGLSKYEMLAPVVNMFDNINSLIAKNIYMMAHAKWMMPRGAAKIEQLGNDNTVIQYTGSRPPEMVQVAPNPPEVYRFRETLLQDIQVLYGNHGISRGEIPRGITASSALQFLNELENARASTEIAKHGFMLIDLAKITKAIAGEKYKTDDGRLVRIVGQNNQFLIRHFDMAHLHKDYDIRFDLSTGIPESKAGKYSRVLDAMQRNPNLFDAERWEELLELGNTEKMVDLATAAIRCADSENEDIAAGRPVAPVEEWEDHIQHLRSHYRFIQSRQFKEEMPADRRKIMKDHIYWTEEAAIAKMMNNPEFEAELATLRMFPLFHHPSYVAPRSRAQMEAEVNGATNMTGMAPEGVQIPGEEQPDLTR